MPVSAQPKSGSGPGDPSHLPQLDGARGLAVLMVLLLHLSNLAPPFAVLRLFHQGWMGVDLFFVLSGFLITRILAGRSASQDYYRRFYIRRGLRIWPLYFAVLAAAFALAAVARRTGLAPLPEATGLSSPPALVFLTPAWMYVFFVQNFCRSSLFAASDLLSVSWSLCIEEHFYLTWPLAVRHMGQRGLRALLWAVLALCPVMRFIATRLTTLTGQARYEFLYRLTPLHLDSIAAGCLLYLYWIRPQGLARSRCWMLLVLAVAGTCVCLKGGARLPHFGPLLTPFLFSMVAAACASLTGLALRGWGKGFFTLQPLRYLGRISYGVYLLHLVMISLTEALLVKAGVFAGRPEVLREVALAVGFPAGIGLAALSFRYFETPFLQGKRIVAP